MFGTAKITIFKVSKNRNQLILNISKLLQRPDFKEKFIEKYLYKENNSD